MSGSAWSQEKVRTMSEPERAWVGAFIDGEGSLYQETRGYNRLSGCNTEVELISTLIRATGVGKVYLQPQIGLPLWVWRVNRLHQIQEIARQIKPYCLKAQKWLANCAISNKGR